MFGDDPELHTGVGFVCREQTRTDEQALLVLQPVVFVEVAPIASVMTTERRLHFVIWNAVERARCRNNLAERELFGRRIGCAGSRTGEINHVVVCGGAALTGGRNGRLCVQVRFVPRITSPSCSASGLTGIKERPDGIATRPLCAKNNS